MDQIKIGKFISEKRKEKKLTQNELASKLNITDRSVSKWERGICMPDAGTIPELCKILDISINDLFSGDKIGMKESEKKLEENLLEMTKLKEAKDKELLKMEIIIGILALIILFGLIAVASLVKMPDYLKVILIVVGFIIFMVCMFCGIKIEQIAGYYECKHCHYKYVPTYKSVFFATHVNRTRKMKCPKCGKKSWQKKVLK